MKEKTNFNMQLSVTQKEIMDFVSEVIFENTSKADTINELFRNAAFNYLGIEENIKIDDITLLSLLKEEKLSKDLDMISMIGVEKFANAINENKSKGLDTSYYEKLLDKYNKKVGGK